MNKVQGVPQGDSISIALKKGQSNFGWREGRYKSALWGLTSSRRTGDYVGKTRLVNRSRAEFTLRRAMENKWRVIVCVFIRRGRLRIKEVSGAQREKSTGPRIEKREAANWPGEKGSPTRGKNSIRVGVKTTKETEYMACLSGGGER